MSKEKPYPEYSDFGQEWLGELPAHWKLIRTKILFDLVSDPAPVGNSEELLSVYTALGVKPRKDLEARGNKASSTDNYWRVEKGDIIVNKLLAWMGAIGISEYKGVTSPAYDILRPKENVNPYFYNYLFRNPIASNEFKRHSRGIMDMRLRLYFTRFGDIKLPYPPIHEQNKIVEFLQFKLNKIDRFIRKKKQLIKLLNEQKAAIINQAVTKGLDPNVKMKPSGIEWLGDIPEHWAIEKGFSLFDLKNDILAVDEIKKLKVVHYSIPNIQEFGTGILEDGNSIDSNKFKINGGELLYSKLNPRKGTVVITKTHKETAIASSEFVVLVPKNDNILFYYYFLKSFTFKQAISSQVRSATKSHERVKPAVIFRSHFPKPTRNEQENIATFLNTELEAADSVIKTIEKEISFCYEYKTALIAEAVTGKIDVRDFVVPENLEEENYEDLEEELNIVAEDEGEYENEELEE